MAKPAFLIGAGYIYIRMVKIKIKATSLIYS